MSNPECLFNCHVVFCGTQRSVPTLALYKVTSSKLELKDEITLKTERKFQNEIMISIKRIDKQNDFERLLTCSSHRRLFLLHVTPKKFHLAREFDLSFPGQFQLEFGVKTLYTKGDYAVFYTDNNQKKDCVIRFLGYDNPEQGDTIKEFDTVDFY